MDAALSATPPAREKNPFEPWVLPKPLVAVVLAWMILFSNSLFSWK
jgi:hypothetical protein